jgi:hypothetical protein
MYPVGIFYLHSSQVENGQVHEITVHKGSEVILRAQYENAKFFYHWIQGNDYFKCEHLLELVTAKALYLPGISSFENLEKDDPKKD